MENLEPIQKIISDPDFRGRVVELEIDDRLPFDLLNDYPEYNRDELELARKIVLSHELPIRWRRKENKSKLWDAISDKIDDVDSQAEEEEHPIWQINKKRSLKKQFLRYASVVVGILIGGYGIYSGINIESPIVAKQNVTILKRNSSGQKSKIHLSDGSIVHLNAQSEISYPKGFDEDKREIHLKGEAYFEVAKNVNRPFTVISKSVATTALGTEFNVNSFSNDVQIALIEGSVEVKSMVSENKLLLSPSDVVAYKPSSGQFLKTRKTAEESVLWTNSIIYFDKTPIEEVIATLNRWYAVDITTTNKRLDTNLTVSGSFKNQSLELVLNKIGYSLDFEYQIEGQNVLITFN